MSDFNRLCCCSQKLVPNTTADYLICPSKSCIFLIRNCEYCHEPADIFHTKEDNEKNHDRLYWKHCNKFLGFVNDATSKYYRTNVDDKFICNLIRYFEFSVFKHILFRYTILKWINVENCNTILSTRYLLTFGRDLSKEFFQEWNSLMRDSAQPSSTLISPSSYTQPQKDEQLTTTPKNFIVMESSSNQNLPKQMMYDTSTWSNFLNQTSPIHSNVYPQDFSMRPNNFTLSSPPQDIAMNHLSTNTNLPTTNSF